jgi:Ca2+-binding RTX toxin-like protein
MLTTHLFRVTFNIVMYINDCRRDSYWNNLIDHLQVVTTHNYNTITDFHTTNHSTLSSHLSFTSLYVITALNNVQVYSSAMISLDVSW